MRDRRLAKLNLVYKALEEKGYCPIGQIAGYILTGDPTYITNHNGARQLVTEIDRYELLKDMLSGYFHKKNSMGNKFQ